MLLMLFFWFSAIHEDDYDNSNSDSDNGDAWMALICKRSLSA